jgi:hypothetical protein
MESHIKRIISQHPSLRNRLRQNPSTGCLEYIGPKIGSIEGNPQLTVRKIGYSVSLRTLLWTSVHGPVPRKKCIVMKCRNHRCQRASHMILEKKRFVYRTGLKSYVRKLPRSTIYFVLYLQGKVTADAVANCFHITFFAVRSLWNNRTGIVLPPNYKPPVKFVQLVEKYFSKNRKGFFLSEQHLREAKNDILASPLEKKSKEVLLRYISGESAIHISNRFGIDNNTFYDWKKMALFILRENIGKKKWIQLIMKES